VIWRFVGMWAVRRAYRLLTAPDARPLKARLTREAKRILIGAAITLALLALGAIVLIVVLIALVMWSLPAVGAGGLLVRAYGVVVAACAQMT
jgi:hypothetical protein